MTLDEIMARPLNERLVLRACFAHGEQGDWDMGAVLKHLVHSDGLTEAEASEAISGAASSGLITIELPPLADLIQFPSK